MSTASFRPGETQGKGNSDPASDASNSRLKEYLIRRNMVFVETYTGRTTTIEIKAGRKKKSV